MKAESGRDGGLQIIWNEKGWEHERLRCKMLLFPINCTSHDDNLFVT